MTLRPVRESIELTGRTALITGGAGHIGRSVAAAFAELGATVLVADLSESGCQEAADLVNRSASGNPASPVAIDLSDAGSIEAAAARIHRDFGRLDILVHAAALVGTSDLKGWAVDFDRQSGDSWRQALDVNLTSAFLLVQKLLPSLRASPHASVILVGSTYGVVGGVPKLYESTELNLPAAYAASKGGLIQLAKYLATALAPEIRVNAISPGGVWRGQPDVFVKRYEERTPLGRMAREEDLVGSFVYLAGDMSRYVTGTNLMVDGGWTAW